ncbi:MAG TPA: DUF6572 domain-containing protein [Flavobacterium sp.]|nr:DUF6572 domain-containing protein [Flavobacterium sp.]
MSVENKEVIDFISIDSSNKVALTISDHLKWDKEDHFLLLQDKINAYLEIIEDGQIYEIYPDAVGKNFVIQVAMKYGPNKKAKEFLESVKEFLEDNNYEFKFYELKDDQ